MAVARRKEILAEIATLGAELVEMQSVTAALLERPPTPATPRVVDTIQTDDEGSRVRFFSLKIVSTKPLRY